MSIRIVLADDHELVRAGFRLILQGESDLEVVGDAADGRAAVEIAARLRPDVVLMDIRMPVLDGLAATRALVADPECECRIVVLTTFDDDEHVFAALQAGASGYLLKDAPADQLVTAIRVVARGESMLSPALTSRLVREVLAGHRRDLPSVEAVRRLSGREREVLVRIAEGASNQEIAAALVVSEATVKTHVAHILAKLGARDRVQAVITAFRSGLAE